MNKTKSSKDKLKYWESRVYKSVSTRDGKPNTNWSCAFQFNNRRMWMSLGTSVKSEAANKALAIYRSLTANGWELTLAKYKPAMTEKKIDVTLGEFLQAVRENCSMENGTRTGYETCLRRIVSDIFKIDGQRHDWRAGGRQAWIAKVHAVKLAKLTPEKVQQWQIAFLTGAKSDPLSQRRAKTSCNTTLRQAKSLFSANVLSCLDGVVELPSPLPFSKVKYSERQNLKYQSDVDIDRLIQDAESELAASAPELYKIFLLGCMAGLRRREIDLLEWSSFKWDTNEIQIKRTKYFEAKTEDSYGSVQVDPELMSVFRGYRPRASSDFVIESDLEPSSAEWNRYRCQPHFRALAGWLREHGIEGDKPIHVLRKEFGSRINENGDIHAASMALRHADIGITAQFYADGRKRVTTDFGRLLKSAPVNVVAIDQADVFAQKAI
jgi:integrase